MKQIIFILGLPRSGTTLLQRLLSKSPEVETVSESWLFLPFLSFREQGHHKSVYGTRPGTTALNAFLGNDMRLENAIAGSLREYLDLRYPDHRYFCEKTPRNTLYADKLRKLFPDDRYLIINRNPLNIAASIFRTFEQGKLNTYKFRVDLELGMKQLIGLNKNPAGALIIRYEDLTEDPPTVLSKLNEYLDLELDINPNQKLPTITGEMGDPTGQYELGSITARTDTGYLNFIDSIYRKRWFLHFLERIGEENFSLLGYDYEKHMSELRQHKVLKPIGFNDLLTSIGRTLLELISFRILPRRRAEIPSFIQY